MFLMCVQLQADILQVPVQRPEHLETTSLGAALAAGIGVGFWTKEEAFTDLKHATNGTLFQPQVDADNAQKRHDKWKKAVSRSIGLADLAD
jgi:glycerol kinase